MTVIYSSHFSIQWTKPHPKKLRTEVKTHSKLGNLLFSSCDTASTAPTAQSRRAEDFLSITRQPTDMWAMHQGPVSQLWPPSRCDIAPGSAIFFKFLLFLCLFSILSVGWKVFPLSHCSVLFCEPWTKQFLHRALQYTMLVPGKSSLKTAYFYNWTYSYEMHSVPHYV